MASSITRKVLTIQEVMRISLSWQSEYFPLCELLYSEKAESARLSNLPTSSELFLLSSLVLKVLDPIRRQWGEAIKVTSGFRDPQVNTIVGGVSESDHQCQLGAAVDIAPLNPTADRVKKLCRMICESQISFDQIIFYGSRLHIGYRGENNRREMRLKEGEHFPFVTDTMLKGWPEMAA